MSYDPYSGHTAAAATGAGKDETSAVLAAASGVAVVQKSQWGEALAEAAGIAYQAKNKYKVSVLPPGIKVSALRFLTPSLLATPHNVFQPMPTPLPQCA
jgi:hypothetical protein